MTAAKPLARYSATQGRARERLPNRPSYTIQWDTGVRQGFLRHSAAAKP